LFAQLGVPTFKVTVGVPETTVTPTEVIGIELTPAQLPAPQVAVITISGARTVVASDELLMNAGLTVS
jgi:hypothetical protein